MDWVRIITEDFTEEYESWRKELVQIKVIEIPRNDFNFVTKTNRIAFFLQTRHLNAYAWLHTSVRQVPIKIKV